MRLWDGSPVALGEKVQFSCREGLVTPAGDEIQNQTCALPAWVSGAAAPCCQSLLITDFVIVFFLLLLLTIRFFENVRDRHVIESFSE